jgi:uncharacterized metal-binding protein YceD (DUF177 family)
MKLKDEYVIPYSGLAIGKHEFDWKIEDKFFEARDYSEVKKGELFVDLVLEKRPSFLELSFSINGAVELECDRCTVDFNYQLDFEEKLIVKFVEDGSDDASEEIIILGKNDHELHLADHLYEYIAVRIPIRKVGCELLEDKNLCNQDVLKLIENLSPKENESHLDPRWEKLNGLELN